MTSDHSSNFLPFDNLSFSSAILHMFVSRAHSSLSQTILLLVATCLNVWYFFFSLLRSFSSYILHGVLNKIALFDFDICDKSPPVHGMFTAAWVHTMFFFASVPGHDLSHNKLGRMKTARRKAKEKRETTRLSKNPTQERILYNSE